MIHPSAKFRLRSTSILLLLGLLISPLHAQAPVAGTAAESWVGKKVITKLGASIRVGGNVIDQRKMHHTFLVRRSEDGRLWIESQDHPDVKGFVLPSEVVLYEQAIDYCAGVLQAEPTNVEALIVRGWHWRNDRADLASAMRDFNEAIRLDRNNAAAFRNRGNVWCAKNEGDKALADQNEAIRLDPIYAAAYCDRGWAWYAKADYDKAIADCNDAVRLDPKYAFVYTTRASSWYAKDDYDRAVADCNESIRLKPGDAWAHSQRGAAWHAKSDYDKAIADYTEAIRLNPEDAFAYENRGHLWYAKKEMDRGDR
jgi:tetratricopeptide (TPR) repeat protein